MELHWLLCSYTIDELVFFPVPEGLKKNLIPTLESFKISVLK